LDSITSSNQNIDPEMSRIYTEVLGSESNYKDRSVFNIKGNITHELFYHREQFNELAKPILEFLKFGDGQTYHPFVVGTRGSGKTALVKYCLNEAKKLSDFEDIYVNCSGMDNCYQIMKEIIGDKKKTNKQAVRGMFFDRMKRGQEKKIMVLDEIDLLKDDGLFYDISRDDRLNNVLIIMITKTPRFYENFSLDVKSSFTVKLVFFDSYGFSDLKELFLKRAEAGLKSYDAVILQMVAAHNAKHMNGDARIGIAAINRIFSQREHPCCNSKGCVSEETEKMIRQVMDEEYLKFKESIIRHLNEIKLAILYYVYKTKRSNIAFNEFRKNVYTSLSKSNFFKQIDELQYLDLFTSTRQRIGRSTIYNFRECVGESNVHLVTSLLKQKQFHSELTDTDQSCISGEKNEKEN